MSGPASPAAGPRPTIRPNVWAVIPVKVLAEGKSRLASVLSNPERARLNREFFLHTLQTAGHSERLARIVVVSADPEVRALASEAGARVLVEAPPLGLNRALGQGASEALANGASHVLSLSIDLPHLTAGDLDDLIASALANEPPSVTVATDEAGQGTNAMVVAPPEIVTYHYGRDSLARHRAAAERAGADFTVVHRVALQFDVDSPEDLRRWREAGSGSAVEPGARRA